MSAKEIDIIEQVQKLWEWLFRIEHWNTLEGWTARLIVWCLVTYVLVYLAKHLFEMLATLAKAWKSLGLEIHKSPVIRTQVRRRRQFAKVLAADLATLAKAENWNDQYFTDLEAEVEAEGEYYATSIDRMLRRRSAGLRRVSSLIEAIESSAEQCLLLTGEPGSGKSVALRHLANQLADKATQSKAADAKIPLYINLKELPSAESTGPTADFIKEFVFENIRRGDADTAAFVRDNWNDYRERGIWFFLFDSFDEIPAVLHAPTGSHAIRQHTDAIRHFLHGMSECRGVLASREFKGPDSLPWKTLRILPLTPSRQEDLIDNSFLLPEQKAIALRHAIASSSGVFTNPLFLTLLCRYVREVNKAPSNDNELLLRHIERLAEREPDHLTRRYGLTPSELIDGSVRLAVLFAEQPSLSLAPTQDEIAAAVVDRPIPCDDLERLLAALIDVKIGRCDVKEARAGDRRFAFAHRRYQETLFVKFLAANPSYLSPTELLTDLRWREYTVTLLQTGSQNSLVEVLNEALGLLEQYRLNRVATPILPSYGSGVHYYEWDDAPAVRLIQLLQEGLGRRTKIVPMSLREKIRDYLSDPWNHGDPYDRMKCLTLGALLPDIELNEKLKWAVDHGTEHHWEAAFASSMFVETLAIDVADWVRRELAERLLGSKHRADVLKLEAIAARLPAQIGAGWIVARARAVRTIYRLLTRAVAPSFQMVLRNPRLSYRATSVRKSFVELMQVYLLFGALIPFLVAMAFVDSNMIGTNLVVPTVLVAIGIWLSVVAIRQNVLYSFRAFGGPLSIGVYLRVVRNWLSNLRRVLRPALQWKFMTALLMVCVMWVVVGAACHLFARLVGYNGRVAVIYLFAPAAFGFMMAVGMERWEAYSMRMMRRRLTSVDAHRTGDDAFIMCANSWHEAFVWISKCDREIFRSSAEVRSFLCLLDASYAGRRISSTKSQMSESRLTPRIYRMIAHHLLARLAREVSERD